MGEELVFDTPWDLARIVLVAANLPRVIEHPADHFDHLQQDRVAGKILGWAKGDVTFLRQARDELLRRPMLRDNAALRLLNLAIEQGSAHV